MEKQEQSPPKDGEIELQTQRIKFLRDCQCHTELYRVVVLTITQA